MARPSERAFELQIWLLPCWLTWPHEAALTLDTQLSPTARYGKSLSVDEEGTKINSFIHLLTCFVSVSRSMLVPISSRNRVKVRQHPGPGTSPLQLTIIQTFGLWEVTTILEKKPTKGWSCYDVTALFIESPCHRVCWKKLHPFICLSVKQPYRFHNTSIYQRCPEEWTGRAGGWERGLRGGLVAQLRGCGCRVVCLLFRA